MSRSHASLYITLQSICLLLIMTIQEARRPSFFQHPAAAVLLRQCSVTIAIAIPFTPLFRPRAARSFVVAYLSIHCLDCSKLLQLGVEATAALVRRRWSSL